MRWFVDRRPWLVAPLLLTLGGCDWMSRDASELRISVREYETFDHRQLSLSLTEGQRSWELTGDDLFVPPQPPPLIANSPTLQVANSGTLAAGFSLAAPDGTLISAGTVEIQLRADWNWHIGFYPEGSNPYLVCFGCVGSAGFPIDPAYRVADQDSLWVVWGGGPRSRDIIY
jgi:hypothetical protein